MKVDVLVCARCGGKHLSKDFRRLYETPKAVWWWAVRPKTSEPIVIEEVRGA